MSSHQPIIATVCEAQILGLPKLPIVPADSDSLDLFSFHDPFGLREAILSPLSVKLGQAHDPAKADLFAHNELVIHAPCERVWQHIIDATKWPEWYPNAKAVQVMNGTVLGQGSVFRWTTFGLAIESKVNEFVPYTRIGWYGYAPGTEPTFYHTWFLTETGDGCSVVTDEVGIGKDAAHLRETDEGLMHRGHDLWLATLKWMSEGR